MAEGDKGVCGERVEDWKRVTTIDGKIEQIGRDTVQRTLFVSDSGRKLLVMLMINSPSLLQLRQKMLLR